MEGISENPGGLSRSNSMRASLRLLGTRLRSSSLSNKKKFPFDGEILIEHYGKKWAQSMRTQMSPTNENIPMNYFMHESRDKAQRSRKNAAFRILKRSISLKGNMSETEERQATPRVATIRRASIWANSVTSKTLHFKH